MLECGEEYMLECGEEYIAIVLALNAYGSVDIIPSQPSFAKVVSAKGR